MAESEPNDTVVGAQPLPVDGWVSGTRNPASGTEQDIFKFTAFPGDTVFLSLDLDPERDPDFVQWDGRLLLGLFGDDTNFGIEADNAGVLFGDRASEALVLTIRDGGTYYAVVDSASAAVGGPQQTFRRFAADFENGANEFEVLGGEWELGLPSLPKSTGTAAFTDCHSGKSRWKTDLDGIYANSTTHLLSSPEIDLAGWVGKLTISWAQRFQIEESWKDRYVVELTALDGSNPKTIWEWQDGAMRSFPGSAETAVGGSSGWSVVSRSLPTYILPGEQFKFRLRLVADSSNSYGGVAFDDIEIVGCDAGPLILEHGFEAYDDEPWSATVP